MTYSDNPTTSWTLVIGFVGAILVVVILIALSALYYRVERAEVQAKSYPQAPAELTRLRAEQQEQLWSYAWVDRANGVVSIPIDRAMALVAQEAASTSDTATTRPAGAS